MFGRFRESIRRTWRIKAESTDPNQDGVETSRVHATEEEDVPPLVPPTAARVSRRAACLAAVTSRGWLESLQAPEFSEVNDRLVDWVRGADLEDELEEGEAALIYTPYGELADQMQIDACWRSEGLVVLAAALQRCELPAFDTCCVPREIAESCGLFLPAEELKALHQSAELLPRQAIEDITSQQLAIHWRIRDRGMQPERIDFTAVAREITWADFNLKGVSLVAGDLGIGGQPVDQAEPDLLRDIRSIVMERHKAANWLIGWDTLYSEVTTDT
ncbi:MAG: DUF4272 domain-containing protein [Planctomycetota bacterium]